jgi:hypothetical protein
MTESASSGERVMVPVESGVYAKALQAAAHFGIPVEEWFDRAARDKLAAEPIRPPEEETPVRTPYVEAGQTTRDTRSSAG